ncbi:putative nucleotidyltransferase [Xanthomonas arboricola]
MTRILHAAIFGSVARSGNDERSDFDVIAIVNSINDLKKEDIKSEIQHHFKHKIDLSIYGKNRISQMWREGSPFAWHLFLESIPLTSYSPGLAEELGRPADYTSPRPDIEMMSGIIISAKDRLLKGPVKARFYEAGLLYVGSRNCAMYASKEITGSFDFSRLAPYKICQPQFPVSLDDYNDLTSCRHASTRGGPIPEINPEKVRDNALKIVSWVEGLSSYL